MSPQDNPEIATALLLCTATYVDDIHAAFSEQLKDYKLVFNGVETGDGNYAFITVSSSGDYYLAIRGSLPVTDPPTWDEFYNWVVEDLNVFEQEQWGDPTLGAVVSKGTLIAFNSLNGMVDQSDPTATIYPILRDAVSQNKRVILTGHSLGGNMANTFASYFATQLKAESLPTNNIYLYTFAAPGSGNQAFANSVDDNYPGNQSWHFELNNDIVPKFPVFAGVLDISLKFYPNPQASSIQYKDVTLFDAITALAVAILAVYDSDENNAYVQVQNNYQVLDFDLATKYEKPVTIETWMCQMIYQHGLCQYSTKILGYCIDDLKPYVTRYKAAFGESSLCG